MDNINKEIIEFEGNKYEIVYCKVPVLHSTFHKLEEMGFSMYVHYNHNGPDYWDDSMVFCKPEDYTQVEKYFHQSWW